jgi:hypothetical protein
MSVFLENKDLCVFIFLIEKNCNQSSAVPNYSNLENRLTENDGGKILSCVIFFSSDKVKIPAV